MAGTEVQSANTRALRFPSGVSHHLAPRSFLLGYHRGQRFPRSLASVGTALRVEQTPRPAGSRLMLYALHHLRFILPPYVY